MNMEHIEINEKGIVQKRFGQEWLEVEEIRHQDSIQYLDAIFTKRKNMITYIESLEAYITNMHFKLSHAWWQNLSQSQKSRVRRKMKMKNSEYLTAEKKIAAWAIENDIQF